MANRLDGESLACGLQPGSGRPGLVAATRGPESRDGVETAPVHHTGIAPPAQLPGLCAAAQTRAHAMATRGSQGAGEQIAPVPARHLEEQA